MSLTLSPLPDDPAALRALLAEQQARIEALEADLGHERITVEKLKFQIANLRRAKYGQSSERIDEEIGQLELVLEDLVESRAESAARGHVASPQGEREKRQPVRKPLPGHLPRENVEHAAPCVCPSCGGTKFCQVGVDEREVLEYVPAQFKAVVHRRPKLSCRDCESIVQAPMPSLPIERGVPGPGLLAHVLVSKFCDHLPLYRQSEIYARSGLDIDRSTMAEWVGKMAFLLEPLAREVKKHVLSGEAIYADDTPVPVLDPGRGKTKTGRLWVAVRDERVWSSDVPPAVFYRYSPDRKGMRAGELLEGCKGFLHADAWPGFEYLYEEGPSGPAQLEQVSCWAHARRKIFEIHAANGSPAAKELLDRISELFAVEESIRGRPPDERLKERQERAVPLLESLKSRMEEILSKISGKSAFAGAIRYALSRWPSLTRYTTDGRLDISNNAAERAIRPLALGRKNWLFAGSDSGGERAAVIYTLIETAKLNGLDPEAYLRSVIDCIADHPVKRISQLLPWNITL